MDLDEMKAVWSDLGDQLAQQKKMNQDIVLKMTQEKSNSRLGRIIFMESTGVLLSCGGLIYILANFHKLDYWFSITGGIAMIFILLLGIFYGINIIKHARSIDVINSSYAEVTAQFDKFRSLLKRYKKLSIWVAVISPPISIPLFYDLFQNKSIEDDLKGVAVGFILALLLIPLMMKLFFRYYSRNISQVKSALKDIDFKD